MKSIDIEQLKRKNIYKTPNNFFDDVQDNVLKNTVDKDRHSIGFKPNNYLVKWWYAVAAIFVLGFGIIGIFMIENNPVEERLIVQQSSEGTGHPMQNSVDLEQTVPFSRESLVSSAIGFREDLSDKQSLKTSKKANHQEDVYTYDDWIKTLSIEDLAELSHNVEDDIYLDLYY